MKFKDRYFSYDTIYNFKFEIFKNFINSISFHYFSETISSSRQKQPSRAVLRKRCFENMQQIYRRTPMSSYNFNKVAKQLYWNRTSTWVFSCKFAAYFQNIFSQEHLWKAAYELLPEIVKGSKMKIVSNQK